jgi:hypothetical protein
VDGNSSVAPLWLTDSNLTVELTSQGTYLILIKDLNTTYTNLKLEFRFEPEFTNLLTQLNMSLTYLVFIEETGLFKTVDEYKGTYAATSGLFSLISILTSSGGGAAFSNML